MLLSLFFIIQETLNSFCILFECAVGRHFRAKVGILILLGMVGTSFMIKHCHQMDLSWGAKHVAGVNM